MSVFFKELFATKISCEADIPGTAKSEIKRLIQNIDSDLSPLEQMWSMMDTVWREYDCDNKSPTPEKLALFYSHPVWLLNGFFIESDPTSMGHRKSIADWVEEKQKNGDIESLMDFGLALEIAKRSHDLKVVIYEPFPSQFALKRVSQFHNISWSTLLPHDTFSCLVCTDVLEHYEKPLILLNSMISALSPEGYIIIANNFTPCIECHLPGTFYLKRTFKYAARALGLQYIGPCNGSHAHIFQKNIRKWPAPIKSTEKLELICRGLAPMIDAAACIRRMIKRALP